MIPIDFPTSDILIYKSENLAALFSPSNEKKGNTLCITFFPFISPQALSTPRKGQSRETIRDAGIDAIHVIPIGSDWYQYPDLDKLLNVILTYKGKYDDVVCYGQSMGGYAALHTSSILKPQRVLAICPQYTIDKDKIDFNTGFEKDSNRITFLRDDFESNCDLESDLIIAYDPLFYPDKLHYNLYKKNRNNIYPLRMSFCGHGVSESLYSAGLIPNALISLLLNGKDSIRNIRNSFRLNRNKVSRYKYLLTSGISNRAAGRGDIQKATQFARKLMQLKPEFSSYRAYCEIAEKYMSAAEAAARWLETIARLENSTPAYAYVKAIIYLRESDDIYSAEQICARGLNLYPNDFGLRREQINNIISKNELTKLKILLDEFSLSFGERANSFVTSNAKLIETI